MYNFYRSTLTSKGQATIPALLRKKLGVTFGERIIFEENDGKVTLRPIIDISSLRGSLKSKIKYSDKKANEAIGKMFAQEYGKTR